MPFQVPGQRTITRAFSALVRMADPDFDRERKKELEYRFEGGTGKVREFRSDVSKRWPYNIANPVDED